MKIILAIVVTIYITDYKISCYSSDFKSIEKNNTDSDSVKIIGERILKGAHIWGKNEKYIFPLMDSLVGKSDKLFYFKVFGKITEQADGYIAEVIGLYVLKYFEFNPIEFIQNSKYIPEKTFNSMARYAGEEISMSSDNLSKAEEEFEKLKNQTMMKFVNISKADKLKLDQFFNQIKSGLSIEIIK